MSVMSTFFLITNSISSLKKTYEVYFILAYHVWLEEKIKINRRFGALILIASTLWMLVHFRNIRNALVSLPHLHPAPPHLTPPHPPSKSARGGTTNRSEAGCLLTDEWARAGSPCSVATSQTKSFSPSSTRPRIRVKQPRERLRQRWGMCICSTGFHSSVVSGIFLSFFLFWGVLKALRVVNNAPDNRGAALASSPAFNPLPPPISTTLPLQLCFRVMKRANTLLCSVFPSFFFFFLSPLPTSRNELWPAQELTPAGFAQFDTSAGLSRLA